MKLKKRILFTCVLLLGVVFVKAQTAAITGGGEASGSGGTLSYSVGQVACQTHTGNNGSISEGIQQPYKISVVTGKDETGIGLNISAYPNPTTEYFILKTDAERSQKMSFQLFDINGKLLQSEKLTDAETQINLSTSTPATFFMRVLSENKLIKEFKIIKN